MTGLQAGGWRTGSPPVPVGVSAGGAGAGRTRPIFCLPLCLSLALAACATDTREDPSYWWSATVISIQPAPAVASSGVDMDCIAPNERQAGDGEVLVVRYRVGRAPVVKAFAEPRGAAWRAGQPVFVHPDTCRIKPAWMTRAPEPTQATEGRPGT